jgi:hypothetical protein
MNGWRTRCGFTPTVLMFGALSLLNGCSKEAPQAAETQRARHSPAPPVGSESSEANLHTPSGGPPGNLEFQPFERSLLAHAGTLDRANQYVSTVMVTLQGPGMDGGCSGVLLHPRLALTAAHCVCPRREAVFQQGEGGPFIDGTACAGRASVTSVSYETSENPERPTLRIRSYEGQVRPHPRFQLLLDASGVTRTSSADLSVILLDQPVELPLTSVRLADSEVQVQESLVMAGYGHDRIVGSRHGARYSRKNQVTRAPTSAEGRALYAQQGAALYEGFDGGPCFRENGQGRWLVGISGLSTSEGLSFTSTFLYRDWLRAELQRAEAVGSAKPPGTP